MYLMTMGIIAQNSAVINTFATCNTEMMVMGSNLATVLRISLRHYVEENDTNHCPD